MSTLSSKSSQTNTKTLLPLAALVGLVFSMTAQAAPGDHIRAGDATIAPDIDLGFQYRTNSYRSDDDPVGGGNLRISPGLNVSLDTPMNELVVAGEWQIYKYLFVAPTAAEQASGIDLPTTNLDRFNDFNVIADLDALKQDVVGILLHEQASLRNNQADNIGSDTPFTTQIRNEMGGALRVSPGPALGIALGADWAHDDFKMSAVGDTRDLFNRRNAYGPTLNVKWDFFPRTAMVIKGDYLLYRWSENTIFGADASTFVGSSTTATGTTGANDTLDVLLPNSNHLKLQTGIQGRFTKKAFLDLLVGYGTAIYDEATVDAGVLAAHANAAEVDLTGLNGLLATVQVRYKIAEETEFSMGYKKDFADSFFTNYVAYDQVYAQLSASVADVHPMVRYSLRLENYGGDVTRTDLLNRFEIGASYDLQDWASLSSAVNWQQRGVAQAEYASVEYDDVTVNFMGTFTY